MRSSYIIFISILITAVNTQRSSNGRHRTWASEEEPPQSNLHSSLTVNEDLVINQNVPSSPSSEKKKFENNSITVKLGDHSSIINSLTPPEPSAAEILKVNLGSKTGMLLVSSSPTYSLTANQTEKQSDANQANNEKSINFVQTKRMLKINSASKNCLSTLDCDLELNERCLSPESEEVLYYNQLTKLQPYTTVYSQYLKKKWRNLKNSASRTEQGPSSQEEQPICGCAPAFVRNQVTGQCELMRVVELKFKLRTDRTSYSSETPTSDRLSEQNFEQHDSKSSLLEKQSNHHQLKLDVLGQIDHVLKNSDSLQDIVHHFRLTHLTALTPSSRKQEKSQTVKFTNANSIETSSEENVDSGIKRIRRRSASSSKLFRMQKQFVARGLLLLYSSEYTANFDLLFTNEYCSTQNTLRMKAQEKMFHQTLAATTNQTWPTIHFNAIRSADFWYGLSNNTLDARDWTRNQSEDRAFKPKSSSSSTNTQLKKSNKSRMRNENRPIELPFIHHRKRREANNIEERFGLDVQLTEVNSDQINICTLNANYANEQLNEARRKYDLITADGEDRLLLNGSQRHSAELERKQKQLDYERRFLRLTYCDDSRAYCESLPRSRAGYVCICHGNLYDLSPFPELPGEYCGIKCPSNYCGAEGFCHVRNSVGNYPSPDHDATQQRYLSTAGRVMSFMNGNLPSEKKKDENSSKQEATADAVDEERPALPDYRPLIEEHKKNQTLLRQRYYAAIYSVQQRFIQLFESMPKTKLLNPQSSPLQKKENSNSKTTDEEKYMFDYTYSFVQEPQMVTFYCTCPNWTFGSRCQFSGWYVLMVLGILVILLAFIVICTCSMQLCTRDKSSRRDSTKSSKSTKSILNTTSLTVSESTSDSLDMETGSQQFNNASSQQSQHHHNQFNTQQNRTRRASEFVNDRRSSFGQTTTNTTNQSPVAVDRWVSKPIMQPAFKIIHATPPHVTKESTPKIQFTDTITEIPYDLPYERDIAQISTHVQQHQPASLYNAARRPTSGRIAVQQDRPLLKKHRPAEERRFEFYDRVPNSADVIAPENHVYNTIDNEADDKAMTVALLENEVRKETTTTPIGHVHNVYASAGELRVVKSDELTTNEQQQIERRSVGSQTSGFQSADPSLAYLSAISLKQLQYEQQHNKAHQLRKSNQLPTTSISGPIVWF